MAKNNTYLIIGIGRFGRGFFRRLLREGVPPKNIYLVDEIKDNLTPGSNEGIDNIFVANVTVISDIDNIIPINYIDNIVVSTSKLETSVSIVASILEEESSQNKKSIYVKSGNDIHSLILVTLGVPKENIIIPEEEVGSRMALRSLFDSKIDVLDLGINFSLFGIEFRSNKLVNVSISEIVRIWDKANGGRRWNIILITSSTGQQRFPTHNDNIQIGERITFCCEKSERKKIYNFFNKSK